jgi:hypothetical protein
MPRLARASTVASPDMTNPKFAETSIDLASNAV